MSSNKKTTIKAKWTDIIIQNTTYAFDNKHDEDKNRPHSTTLK